MARPASYRQSAPRARATARLYAFPLRGEDRRHRVVDQPVLCARLARRQRQGGCNLAIRGADGQTEPYDFVKNYKVGPRFRRQAIRDFLFWEIEPSYNWRVDEPYFDREGAWRVEFRVEFLLFDNPAETVEKQMR